MTTCLHDLTHHGHRTEQHERDHDGQDPRLGVDPGGWTLVDGQRVNPRGHLEVLVNSVDNLDLPWSWPDLKPRRRVDSI